MVNAAVFSFPIPIPTAREIGPTGHGSARLERGVASVAAARWSRIAANVGASGTLNIGAGAAPGTLTTPSLAFGAGTGTLNFNHTSANYVFAPTISGGGTGSVNVLAGTTTLTATNTYTGPTNVNGGTLLVNGSIAPSVLTTVNAGGTLGGNGTVGHTRSQAARCRRAIRSAPSRSTAT